MIPYHRGKKNGQKAINPFYNSNPDGPERKELQGAANCWPQQRNLLHALPRGGYFA
jgi:hypothetical protein